MSFLTLLRRAADSFTNASALHEGVDVTEYFDQLSDEFSIAFTPDDVERLFTLGDLTALIARKLAEDDRPSAEHVIWPAVRRITAYEMGVDEVELHAGIRFVEDLNC